MAEAGIRELRDHLSRFLDRVRAGEEVVITDRGTAIARILPIDELRPFDRLMKEGLIEPAPETDRSGLPEPVPTDGPVSDLVADQRR